MHPEKDWVTFLGPCDNQRCGSVWPEPGKVSARNRVNPTEHVQSSDANRRTVVSAEASSCRVGVILLQLHGEDLGNAPLCCHRLLMRLMRFSLEAEYVPVKTLLALADFGRHADQEPTTANRTQRRQKHKYHVLYQPLINSEWERTLKHWPDIASGITHKASNCINCWEHKREHFSFERYNSNLNSSDWSSRDWFFLKKKHKSLFGQW